MNRVNSLVQPPMDGCVPVVILQILTKGTAYPFSERLHVSLPLAKPGIYTIWRQAEFLYVGIAGRFETVTRLGQRDGLWSDLARSAVHQPTWDDSCIRRLRLNSDETEWLSRLNA